MKIQILGTRGIPAQHGGFETFAEHFSIYLQKKEWQVTVYCQEEGFGDVFEDEWKGIRLVHIPVKQSGAVGTMVFDWKSTLLAIKRKDPVLTLGYNTAIFCVLYRLFGIKNVINMDGIEWKRGKWSKLERLWLYCNEKVGAWLGNHLIADHPEIKNHLVGLVKESKVTVIPYSADILDHADEGVLEAFGLEKFRYCTLIARPEPENSILEIVQAFSSERRGLKLVVLGNYDPEKVYQKKIMDAAGDEVVFVGAIYDQRVVQSLRFFSLFYFHGHTVGGTNPSLVEALGAGNAVLAHDNKYNRWVAGDGAVYFGSEAECRQRLSEILAEDGKIEYLRSCSREWMRTNFTWDKIHGAYEELLMSVFP